MRRKTIYAVMAAGGTIGATAAFLQTLEKLTLLENAHAQLTCNLNSVFSCSNVLNAWQSSVFGFPNSIMCLMLFMTFAVAGFIGLGGGHAGKRTRLAVQTIALATLGFASWFMWQSLFRIHAVCIFCLFCVAGLLLVNWAWLRLNADDLPIGSAARDRLKRGFLNGADIFGWVLLAAVLALTIILKFR